jgi:hypothetical protein
MKSLIAEHARQRIVRKYPNGRKQMAYYYLNGKKVGYRKWDEQGQSFPQYFVNDKKVTKRQYLSACLNDSSLPGFREVDNMPARKLPQVVA